MTTQRVSASYQEIIDLHTESDKVSILGFHTPANAQPVYLLKPFWEAYQKVRYRGCSMSLVPAARLPVDPAQVGYDAGEYPIDARDMLNPILFHGCHGDDLGAILNQFYSGEGGYDTDLNCDIERMFSDSLDHNLVHSNRVGNAAVYESLYYRSLTDSSWLKAHPQRGFRKNMRPMVYRVAVNTPLNPVAGGQANRNPLVALESDEWDTVDDGERSVAGRSVLGHNGSNSYLSGSAMPGLQTTSGDATAGYKVSNAATYTHIQWMTPGIRPLGWIDTRQPTSGNGSQVNVTGSAQTDAERIASLYDSVNGRYCFIPKVFMGVCMLPPAYKTQQYFRIVINHHFDFAKYRGTSMRQGSQLSTVAPNVTDMNKEEESKSKEVSDDGFDGFDDKGVLDD